MRRAGYSSRFMCLCVCHAAALADETFSTIETGINKVGDDQKDLNEADFRINVRWKLGKQRYAAFDL